jgi:hypothetical protein
MREKLMLVQIRFEQWWIYRREVDPRNGRAL